MDYAYYYHFKRRFDTSHIHAYFARYWILAIWCDVLHVRDCSRLYLVCFRTVLCSHSVPLFVVLGL